MKKTKAQLKGLHGLKTVINVGGGSIPDSYSAVKAVIKLQMLRAKKERFLQEEKRAQQKIGQIKILLGEAEKEKEKLVKIASAQIAKLKGEIEEEEVKLPQKTGLELEY